MSQARFHVHDSEIESRIKDILGLDTHIDLGETGRTIRWSDGRTSPERAEFALVECAQKAGVLSDDDMHEAMMEGLEGFLRANRGKLRIKLLLAAEEFRESMLAEPPYEAAQ